MQLIPCAIIATYAALAAAQNATANVFLPTAFENTVHFVASVFGECNGETTYGVRCTAGVIRSGFTCGTDTPVSYLAVLQTRVGF